MYNYIRFVLPLLLLCAMLGASGQSLVPTTPPASAAHTASRSWIITPATNYNNLSWQGRSLGLLESGLEVQGPRRIQLGVFLRNANGHGRTASNQYDADGWRINGMLPLLSERGRRPALSLVVEEYRDKASLTVNTATMQVSAWPTASNTGVRLCAETHGRQARWQAQTGMYSSAVDNAHLANVLLLGGGVELPLLHALHGRLDVTGYHEDYQGGDTTWEIGGNLTAFQSARGAITLGAHYFPRGIPVGGTPFSTVSGIGLIYGNSAAMQLRSTPMGYLTLAGQISF